MSQPTRIIVADDHPIVRAGARLLIDSRPDLELVGEASSANEVMALIVSQSPEIVILDLWMGDDDGLEILHAIKADHKAIQVLIYSMNEEETYAPRCIKAGADGYLMKDRGLEELAVAIDELLAGRRYLAGALKDKMITGMIEARSVGRDEDSPLVQTLTDRELHIFRLIGRGMATGKIAENLGISPRTVGAHRENIKNKMAAESSTELTRMAVTYVEDHNS